MAAPPVASSSERALLAAPVPGGAGDVADGVLDAVGNTKLVRLRRYLRSRPDLSLWAKLEMGNPSGSSKDRPAREMIREAIERGDVAPGGTVVESSSGNLGVALAQACSHTGLGFICVVDPRSNERNLQRMRALGARIELVTEPDPETGDLLAARLLRVAELRAADPSIWWPNQYENPANARAHRDGTMAEIASALGGDLDCLLVATSSAGTLAGCGEYLSEQGMRTELIAVDAEGSVLFGGTRGTRRLPGLGAGIVTAISERSDPDRVIRVGEIESVVGCRRLAAREAILSGASSGAVLWAAESVAADLPHGARIAVVLADGADGYLETVYNDEWVEAELGCEPGPLRRAVEARADTEAAAPARVT